MEKYIGSIVRHALTTVGGVLIAVGVGESETHALVDAATPVVTGVATIAVGIAWSFLEKKAKKVF